MITWMLIHSLWVFGGAFLLSKLGNAITPKSSIRGRIKLVALLLALIAVGVVMLSGMDYEPGHELSIILLEGSGVEVLEANWIQRLKTWVFAHSQLISIIWLLGFMFSILRYYVGYNQIQQIKKYSNACADTKIIQLVNRIKESLKIGLNVEIHESSLINSPLTSGWLKPVIYLPIGMSSGFSFEEIDSILYHELVHIKRYDYLVNLVLASIETLFFFNPFVHAIINDLRSEMEYACDDAVLKHNQKVTYVQALLKLQESKLSNALGLAAKGNNSEFIKRINKMMNKTNNSNERSKLIPGLITCLFIAASLFGSAFVSKSDPAEEIVEFRSTPVIQQDTIKVNSKEELNEKLNGISKEQLASTVIVLKGKVIPVIQRSNVNSEAMMIHIQKELVKDGILSPDNKRVKLMFQYSDLLNGKEVLGDKYEKYKKIFNSYFPVYDSYATTRVFKYDN